MEFQPQRNIGGTEAVRSREFRGSRNETLREVCNAINSWRIEIKMSPEINLETRSKYLLLSDR